MQKLEDTKRDRKLEAENTRTQLSKAESSGTFWLVNSVRRTTLVKPDLKPGLRFRASSAAGTP